MQYFKVKNVVAGIVLKGQAILISIMVHFKGLRTKYFCDFSLGFIMGERKRENKM